MLTIAEDYFRYFKEMLTLVPWVTVWICFSVPQYWTLHCNGKCRIRITLASHKTRSYPICRISTSVNWVVLSHSDVTKWKHFPRYWFFVRGIHRTPMNSPNKSQWSGVLMFSLTSVWTNNWVNNRDASDLRRHHAHYEVTIMHLVSSHYLSHW